VLLNIRPTTYITQQSHLHRSDFLRYSLACMWVLLACRVGWQLATYANCCYLSRTGHAFRGK